MAEMISITMRGARKVAGHYQKMARRLNDMRPVWETAHKAFKIDMEAQFKSQGAHLTGGWEPLSENYVPVKRAMLRKLHGRSAPPAPFGTLYLSGRLFISLAHDGRDHISIMKRDTAKFGTSVPYGVEHQIGRGSTWKVPKRKIIHIGDDFRQVVIDSAMAWIVAGRSLRRA